MKTALYPSTDIAINASPIGFLNKIQERFLYTKKSPKVMLGKYAKKESIGRISVPANPTTPKQYYKPARMSSQQIAYINNAAIGTILYNTSEQTYQRFNGDNWQTITHYPGERLLGGIVFQINETGTTGLLTNISHQITLVQWNDTINRIPVSKLPDQTNLPINQYPLSILQGKNMSYAERMAAHYCVSIQGEMIRGWRIPSLSELLAMLQDCILSASFKAGGAWGFKDLDTVYWLHIRDTHQIQDATPEHYYIRLVREF
ncbi:MAG: hypothetical protein NTZ47_01740 [Bacteroidetes bacterium]|nr:hypothetical protein [Bacteroidota bacterium]